MKKTVIEELEELVMVKLFKVILKNTAINSDIGINGFEAVREGSQFKAYYKRPTPPDLLFEEDFFHNQESYNARSIYEWNLDGLSEYQIMETMHRMLMYACISIKAKKRLGS